MSDLAKLREEVKKNVRALLISAPTGLTPNQLQNDYQGLLGHQLPYRDLGYNSSLDLLRALPDCVQFTYDRGHMILKGVADDTTKHIASLVARQRVSKRRGRGRGSGRSGRVSFVRRIPPPPPRGPAKPVIAQEPSVPAHVRNKIKELLTLYPNGLLGSSFNIAFARRFGHHIDFNAMGFKSLGPLLNSLTGLVRVEQLSSGGFKIFGKDIQACGETRPAVKQCKESKSLHRRDDEFRSDGYFREKTKKEEIRKKPVIQPLMQLKVEEPLDEEIPTEPTNYESENRTEETIDPEIKEEIRALLIKRPAGMWAARLPHEYKRSTDKDLPLKQLGFYSVIELVSLMPDVVSIERPTPKGDWLLYDAKTHHKKPPAEETNTIEVSPKLREKLTDESLLYNIWFTLSRHPNGVFLPNFQTLYLEYTRMKLYPQDYGFKDLVSFLKAMPDVVKVEERLTGHIVLHAHPDYQPPSSMFEDHEEPEKIPLSWKRFGVPPDAVGGGVSYSNLVVPTDVEMLEVYLASVVSPSNFCIQIKSDETSVYLDILMDGLEKIYCYPEGDQYMMPDSMLTVGQVCVSLYQHDNNWHRAVITGIRDSEFVEIMYVDYGNTATVPKSCLRLLKSIFLHLPAQAVQARLVNIKPVKEVWTRATRDRILELCRDKPLIAWVVKVEDNEMSLCLCDTSSDVDIHLNDLLVAEGHALFVPEKPTISSEPQSSTSPTSPNLSNVPPQSSSPPQPVPLPPEAGDAPVIPAPKAKQAISNSEAHDRSVWSMGDGDDDVSYKLSPEDMELVEQMNREIESGLQLFDEGEVNDVSEEVTELKPRYVKRVQLGERAVAHIVNHEGNPYLLSGEVSLYLWEIDMLRAMLRKANVQNVKRIILAQKDHQELFEDVKSHNIPGCIHGDDVKPYLTFYHLSSIPEILRIFECKKEELANYVQEELNAFNKEDGYWKGEDDKINEAADEEEEKALVDDEIDVTDFEYDLEDLKLLLQAMQFRRMRTLQSMISDPDTYLVDELQYIEVQMTDIRNKIKQHEQGIVGAESTKVTHDKEEQITKVPSKSPTDKASGDHPSRSEKVKDEGAKSSTKRSKVKGKEMGQKSPVHDDGKEKDQQGNVEDLHEGKGQRSSGDGIGKGQRSTGNDYVKKSDASQSGLERREKITSPKARIEPMRKNKAALSATSLSFTPQFQSVPERAENNGRSSQNSPPLFGYPSSFQQQTVQVPTSVFVVPPSTMATPTYMPTQLMQGPFVGQFQYGTGLFGQPPVFPQHQIQTYNPVQGYMYNQAPVLTGQGRGKAHVLGFSSGNTVTSGHQNYF